MFIFIVLNLWCFMLFIGFGVEVCVDYGFVLIVYEVKFNIMWFIFWFFKFLMDCKGVGYLS